jgi:hypothetical protein
MKISSYGIVFKVTSKYNVTYCSIQDIMRHVVFDQITNHLSVEILRHGSTVGVCSIGVQDDNKLVNFLIHTLIDEALSDN